MRKHKPNAVPLKTRIVLAVCALFLIAFVLAELATGYTYIPGKRGGLLLSGIPTLMIAICAAALLAATLLTIVDHYDKRPNEAAYSSVKKLCYKTSAFLFVAAWLFGIAEQLMLFVGIDVFPRLRGVAPNYTLHTPELQAYIPHLDPILNNTGSILLAVLAAFGLSALVERFYKGRAQRLMLLLTSIGTLGLSSLWLADTAKDFLSGQIKVERRYSQYIVKASHEPAKFNAILLTHFSLSSIIFAASIFAFVGIATRRIKPKSDF